MTEKKSKKPSFWKKLFTWLVILVIFYVLTSATVSTRVAEVTKKLDENYISSTEPYIVEKMVKTTKYRTEEIPYGTPRCEQFVYNFSKTYSYSEGVIDGKKTAKCTYLVKNEEDLNGVFSFFPNILKTGKINDGSQIAKTIEAFGTARFEWNFTLDSSESASCLLQCQDCPTRMKCFYLQPITYQIKEVPYVVEERKNITEYRDVIKTRTIEKKVNETQNIYTNRFIGYKQFLYLWY